MGYIWDEKKKDDKKFTDHLDKKVKEAITTLTKTNSGLLGTIKKLKKSVKEKSDIDVDEFNKIKTENKQLKKKSRKNESKAEKQLRLAREQHSSEMDKLTKRLDKKDKKDEKNLIKSEILESLGLIGCKSVLTKAARKIIQSDVVIEEGIPMIGDKIISEYIKEWSKTEEGKNFVLAKKNSGGDSSGGNEEEGEDEQEKYFDPKSKSVNLTKQLLLKKSNPELHKQLKNKYK